MNITTNKISPTKINHILTKGNNKTNLFPEVQDYQKYLLILEQQKQSKGFELYGYSLNGNHVHLIIKELQQPLSTIIKSINISYALYFNHKYNREGHLYQGRYKSEIINDPQHLLECVKYLHTENANKCCTSYGAYFIKQMKLVETDFLSSIIENPKTKLSEPLNTSYLFLDVNLNTIIENRAQQYIKNILQHNQLMLYELNIKQYKPLRATIIKKLKADGLAVRTIAKLLNINRNIVQRVKMEDN